MTDRPHYTAPGMSLDDASQVIFLLDNRLGSLIDLSLTLKHIHWNVVGPQFSGVHQMLDTHVDAVRAMVDEVAERIATLGAEPVGTPGYVTETRTWDDYAIGRATAMEHLAALNTAYDGVIADHRAAQARFAELDPVSEDILLGHLRQLELFQWFVRAHLETSGGELIAESDSMREAAARAREEPVETAARGR